MPENTFFLYSAFIEDYFIFVMLEVICIFCVQFPDAFNNDLIVQTLRDILAGKKCEIPVYDYKTNSRYMLYVLYNVLHVFNGNRLNRVT